MPDSNANQPISSAAVPIVILGTDATLAALPATPVQLAHACLRAGFANVIPASWGDELIAAAVLRTLPQFGRAPAIQCSCPIVAHRLLAVSGDLRPVMIPLVPPPVAAARYIRALSRPTGTRITYVGGCPGATDDSIDIRMTPGALLEMLAERRIVPKEEPHVFESIIPPDRRRFCSQPGGVPAADALWRNHDGRTLVAIEGSDISAEIAQYLLAGEPVLIDAAVHVGCLCSGAACDVASADARTRVVAIEPPRAPTPVIKDPAPVELDLPIPAVLRTPIDVMAVPDRPARLPPAAVTTPRQSDPAKRPIISPTHTLPALPESRPPRHSTASISPRAVPGTIPVARGGTGRPLPRAYVARRRSSPKGVAAIPAPTEPEESVEEAVASTAVGTPPTPRAAATSAPPVALPPPTPQPHAAPTVAAAPVAAPPVLSRRAAILIVLLIVAVAASAIFGVIIGRSLAGAPPAAANSPR